MIKYRIAERSNGYVIQISQLAGMWDTIAFRKHFKGARKQLKKLENELAKHGEEYVQNNW